MWLAAKRRINHVVGIAKGDDAVEKCNLDASPLPLHFQPFTPGQSPTPGIPTRACRILPQHEIPSLHGIDHHPGKNHVAIDQKHDRDTR